MNDTRSVTLFPFMFLGREFLCPVYLFIFLMFNLIHDIFFLRTKFSCFVFLYKEEILPTRPFWRDSFFIFWTFCSRRSSPPRSGPFLNVSSLFSRDRKTGGTWEKGNRTLTLRTQRDLTCGPFVSENVEVGTEGVPRLLSRRVCVRPF